MTLSFSKKNIEERQFIPKIWGSIGTLKLERKYFQKGGRRMWRIESIPEVETKYHTIRADKSNRWKVGNKIHFVMNNRQPNRFQFAPVIECTSIQKIQIQKTFYNPFIESYDTAKSNGVVRVDGNILSRKEVERLAINDGFDSVEDFFNYFNEDFQGKIIHWKDKKY